MSRISTRGPKNGICNICGEHGQLTEDHTPPKGCIRITQVEMNHIVEHLAVNPPGKRGRISQNGVKYRTLCKRCNNELLGLNYDPDFIHFVSTVGSFLKTKIKLPSTMNIRAKPQNIIRSLIGHLMAQRVNGYKKGPHTEELGDWFLDKTQALPEYMKIYYWLFPYKSQILARDSVMQNLRSEDTAYFWLMKFFPVAFLVIWDSPTGYDYDNLRTFEPFRNLGADEEAEIPIDLSNLPNKWWPEAPDDQRICVFGGGAIGVVERPPKRRNS